MIISAIDSKFSHLVEVLLREIIFYIVCVGRSDMYKRRYGWDYLFRKSSVIKEYGAENLVVSNRYRNKFICRNYYESKEIIGAGTRIKWPKIRVLPPSLIASSFHCFSSLINISEKSIKFLLEFISCAWFLIYQIDKNVWVNDWAHNAHSWKLIMNHNLGAMG